LRHFNISSRGASAPPDKDAAPDDDASEAKPAA
jgi:hypothetical protein